MSSLFKGSIVFVYIFFCISIMNYDSFNGKQKISIIYLTNVGMVYTQFIGTKLSLALLIAITYLYEEFFQTEDSQKPVIITNPIFKVLDFCYLSIFKDHILWIILALFFESYTVHLVLEQNRLLGTIASFLCLLICYHLLYAEKFQLNTITKMFERFNHDADKKLPLEDEKVEQIFNFIVEIEDKSFFLRPNTYNWISFEFIRYRLERRKIRLFNQRKERNFAIWKYFRRPFYYIVLLFNFIGMRIKGGITILKSLFRGFSTIEMQYIRIIGILSNHRKNIISRKIYELVYSKIFFVSVKEYYVRHMYAKSEVYKQYILFEYLNTVQTKINGIVFKTFSEAFENKNMTKWDMDSVAAAVLGLNTNYIYNERLELYSDVFQKYGVNQERVLKLAEKIQFGKMKCLPGVKKK